MIKFLEILPEKKVYWVISNQLLRSSTSIGANIIEAKASSSRKEFIRYYHIALKSAHESNYWLNLLKVTINDNNLEIVALIKELDEIIRMLTASLLTLKKL